MSSSFKCKYESAFNSQKYTLDSSYELNYSIYLDNLLKEKKIKGWIKNTTKIQLSKSVIYKTKGGELKEQNGYIPDFFVFFNDGSYKIVEIKGWVDSNKNKAILNRVKSDLKGLNFEVVTKKELLAIQENFKKSGGLPFNWIKLSK